MLIFVTEHYYPITKSNAVSQDIIINKNNICLSACDFPIESSDKNIVKLNIPTGIPLVYELDAKLNPIKHYYLGDSSELEKRLTIVESQGKSN